MRRSCACRDHVMPCKTMKAAVENAGAATPSEIRKAVRGASKANMTPEYCAKVSRKVCSNMLKVIAL